MALRRNVRKMRAETRRRPWLTPNARPSTMSTPPNIMRAPPITIARRPSTQRAATMRRRATTAISRTPMICMQSTMRARRPRLTPIIIKNPSPPNRADEGAFRVSSVRCGDTVPFALPSDPARRRLSNVECRAVSGRWGRPDRVSPRSGEQRGRRTRTPIDPSLWRRRIVGDRGTARARPARLDRRRRALPCSG